MGTSKKVCVIGAGPSGLSAARELIRGGHTAVVYEQHHDVGGQWLYQPINTVTDKETPLGHTTSPNPNPNLEEVHSSVYESLRTAVPREAMGFTDFPFEVREGRDTRRFPGHREVWLYLKDFSDHFGLYDVVRFNTRVEYVGMSDFDEIGKNMNWVVRSSSEVRLVGDGSGSTIGAQVVEELFDAVVVATGEFSHPRLPTIRGMDTWKGKQLHSHIYRTPDLFQDEVVVIVGSSLSGREISLELIRVAKSVHLSSKFPVPSEGLSKTISKYDSFHYHPQIASLEEDGKVLFEDGSWVTADTIIYCTGYSYKYSFLDTRGMVTVDDDRVGPLYEHTFPPLLAPSLSFIGLPRKIVAFYFFELQAKWVSDVLAGKLTLPSPEDMLELAMQFYHSRDVAGIPKRKTHEIADFEYCDRLADRAGFPRAEEWKKRAVLLSAAQFDAAIETYRDFFDDDGGLMMIPLVSD